MIKNISVFIGKQTVRYILQNSLLVLFFLMFSVGMLFSASALHNMEDTMTDLPFAFEQFIDLRSNSSLLTIFFRSAVSACTYLFLCYCSGLFMYGYVPSFVLVLFRGLGYGTVSGYLYVAYGLKGVAFALLVVLPGAFINCLILFVGCCEAFRFSVLLSKNYFKDKTVLGPAARLKRYHFKFLVLLGFTLIAALVDSLLSRIFMDVFGF